MPPFKRPAKEYNYSLSKEKQNIDEHFKLRKVPKAANNKLLIASWNITNFDIQKRTDKDLRLMAHLLQRFELIAVQEVHDNYKRFADLVAFMGSGYEWIINDTAGNNERLAFIYKSDKVKPGRLFAEVALPRKKWPRHDVVVRYEKRRKPHVEVYFNHEFVPFDRNPFVGTFEAGKLSFMLANAHLYFGAFRDNAKIEERAKYARRVLEIYALGQWARGRTRSKNTYDQNVLIVGDLNVPAMEKDNAAYRALVRSGLMPLDHFSKTGGSNLAGDKAYDQIAVNQGKIGEKVLGYDVFDFDNAIFRSKWDELQQQFSTKPASSKFNAYVKSYISDHRPLWMQIDIS